MIFNKKLLTVLFSLALVGCEKNQQELTNQLNKDEVASVAKVENDEASKLTEQEINYLYLISDNAESSPSDVKLAEIYLNNLDGFKAEEIRDFIQDYYDRQSTEKNTDELKMEYSIDAVPTRISYGYFYRLNVLSQSENVDVDRVEVNRGNCPIRQMNDKSLLNFGESMEFRLDCNPQNVLEVTVYLKDGREYLMKPYEE